MFSPWGIRKLQLCTSLAILTASSGCHTSEVTGRRQFILVGERQELKLGLDAYRQILGESKLSSDAGMTTIVRRVGQRIAASANRPDFEWEFNLIESPQVNAFCLPGGKIAVYTGILPVLENEGGLAAVMGHEVAHALLRHGAERMSQHMAADLINEAVAIGVRDVEPEKQKLILQAFGVGSQVGVLLPYSRTHELEADRVGLTLAAQAGYDPREAEAVWQRMKAAGGNKPPEFLSTHPSEDRRIQQMREEMPGALRLYEQARTRHGLGERWGAAQRRQTPASGVRRKPAR